MAEFINYIQGKKDRCPLNIQIGTEEINIMFDNEDLQNVFYAEFLKSSLKGESVDTAKGMVRAIQIFARHNKGITIEWLRTNGGD